jgi:hypothetical protein
MQQVVAYNGTDLDMTFIRLKPVEAEEVTDVSVRDFLKPGQIGISLPLWTVWLSFGFSYYGIILYVTRIFDQTSDNDDGDSSCDFDYKEIFVSALSEIIGVLIASSIIDRWGRVPTQTIMYALAGLGALVMGVLAARGASHSVISVFGVISRCSVMAASCATW